MRCFKSAISAVLITCCLTGCFLPPEGQNTSLITDGYRPVYSAGTASEIELVGSRPVKNPGKIYLYKDFLLINEISEGIHVFDNSEQENPKDVGFIQILGNTDLAIKDDVLYADHMGNLVALTIDNFKTVTKVGSLPLQNWELGIPPPAGSYFECVDPSKGLVIKWTNVVLKNPACYAIN